VALGRSRGYTEEKRVGLSAEPHLEERMALCLKDNAMFPKPVQL